MEKQIDVSVVVTVYNLEAYIGECLDSILAQNEISLEVICVDDVSSDKSYEILQEYANKDSRVMVYRNETNLGLASSRNAGFRKATGKYLYNIDGDDLLNQGALKCLYTYAEENDLDLLGFSAISFFENDDMRRFGSENEYVRKKEYTDIKTGAELFAELIENDDRASANVVLYFLKREFFEAHNLYAPEGLRYADDSMFAIYMAAQRAMCISDQLYLRRYRVGSACTSPMKKVYLESMMVLFLNELQIWQDANLDESLNLKIEKYFNKRLESIKSFNNSFKKDNAELTLLNQNIMAKYFYKYFIQEIPIYNKCFSEKDIEDLKKSKIILYGAGYVANEVAKVLEYHNIEDYTVAVSHVDGLQHFRGRVVYEVDSLCNDKDSVILVATAKKYHEDIKKTLQRLDLNKYYYISY